MAASAIVGAVAIVGLATPAQAATASVTDIPTENCGTFIETGLTICVTPGEDLHAAVKAETGQTILEGTTTGSSDRRLAATAAASYLLGKVYDDAGYGGGSKEFYGIGAGCNSSNGFGFADIGSAWYGRVSSFQGYSGCKVKIFEKTNYGGATYGFYSASTNVGAAMNDRTKSIQFHV